MTRRVCVTSLFLFLFLRLLNFSHLIKNEQLNHKTVHYSPINYIIAHFFAKVKHPLYKFSTYLSPFLPITVSIAAKESPPCRRAE